MEDSQSELRCHVRLMGKLLGNAIREQYGEPFFHKIELIRTLSKSARAGEEDKRDELLKVLNDLQDEELLPVVRAFSQFLNLANITEQYHASSEKCNSDLCLMDTVDNLFSRLEAKKFSAKTIRDAVEKLDIELVLTAHPTEVTRRTLIHKYTSMTECLDGMENYRSPEEKKTG